MTCKSMCSVCSEPICTIFFFFFFQAEDGIRDYKVTGVQTCALPIFTYDCDVQIKHIASGGAASGRVPSRGQIGYLKLAPSGELTPLQLADVFHTEGA